jgi:hypothetical protein
MPNIFENRIIRPLPDLSIIKNDMPDFSTITSPFLDMSATTITS